MPAQASSAMTADKLTDHYSANKIYKRKLQA
jgi:hypothetical protein